ncbi:MAG: DEAD/DEAH box helicase, partial [Bacteroidaceae bacterium]|nr:DEAD/DEAH box helicase [Bacteroidaceae bacterium]
QNKVTREVKEDMESNRPMDRLVCGDVGFGKTEVAVRAAFKAACDNKQVAVLVPTTVLALQHYNTFRSRLKNFPVTVDYLTRARTAKQTKELLENLAAGKTDIVIGTHRLIGKSVKFKDLGLLIIDEEQKFGVAVKEKLRQMKVNVDTLTMSATPIPRTLQFSLMGARDFSVIQTPPPNRFPIQTEVLPFSHEVIADAIGFELSRNGQVFFVTNRVAALPNLKALVEKYVPNVRVAVGHGQMPPEQLERTVIDFINHEYDVLISTTIVENGIDIPNANTIIVDAAHTFGLSDLHQMRGRVGRSNRKAFCFLLSPPLSLLKDDARRRLQAIETFSDLGSGINIAMQDLEIRGAGNLLGAEQSGFIADLGFEAYQKILGQALSELKTDEFAELYTQEQQKSLVLDGTFFVDDCSVETDTNAYFPETYVPGATERMLLYRELDNLKTQEEVQTFRLRMLDRFGEMPTEGEELLCIVPLRTLARKCGVERLSLHRGKLILYFVSQLDSAFYQSETFGKVIDYAMNHLRSCKLDENQGKRRMTVASVQSMRQALEILRGILGE